jgi:uncharacterized protein
MISWLRGKQPEPPLEQLFKASQGGDVERVRTLLDGPSPPPVDGKGEGTGWTTAVECAADRGQWGVVALLIERGANVNTKCGSSYWMSTVYPPEEYGFSFDGRIPIIMFAAHNGHRDVVALLLERGADINATSVNGNTALIWAAYNRQREVVALLLDPKWGVTVDARNKAGKTAEDVAGARHERYHPDWSGSRTKELEIKRLLQVG